MIPDEDDPMLRDYIAMQVLPSLIQAGLGVSMRGERTRAEALAEIAYDIADAMVAEQKKRAKK